MRPKTKLNSDRKAKSAKEIEAHEKMLKNIF